MRREGTDRPPTSYHRVREKRNDRTGTAADFITGRTHQERTPAADRPGCLRPDPPHDRHAAGRALSPHANRDHAGDGFEPRAVAGQLPPSAATGSPAASVSGLKVSGLQLRGATTTASAGRR